MRINDTAAARLKELGVELRPGVSLAEKTSLGIGGTTDELLLRRYETIPELIRLLADENIPHRFLGGGTNVLIADGELPWVVLHLAHGASGHARRGECGVSWMRRPISAAWSRSARSTTSAAWKA